MILQNAIMLYRELHSSVGYWYGGDVFEQTAEPPSIRQRLSGS